MTTIDVAIDIVGEPVMAKATPSDETTGHPVLHPDV